MELKNMGNKYIGETGSKVSMGKREQSLSRSLTKNPAERVLMESHKRGGSVGSQQKCRKAMGGEMTGARAPRASSPGGGGYTPSQYSKGGHAAKGSTHASHHARIKRALGGAITALQNADRMIGVAQGMPGAAMDRARNTANAMNTRAQNVGSAMRSRAQNVGNAIRSGAQGVDDAFRGRQ